MKYLLIRYARRLSDSVCERGNGTYCTVLALITCFAFSTPAYTAPTLSQGSGGKQGYGSHKSSGTGHHLRSLNVNMEKLRFEVILTDNAQATAIEEGLAGSGFNAKFHAAKGSCRPYITAEIDRGVDLNQLLGLIGVASEIPTAKPGPFYDLVIYASFDKEGAIRAIDQLSRVSGVDAKQSTTDILASELHIRITGNSPVSADDISQALALAGITGKFKNMPASNMKVTSGISNVFALWPSWLTWRTGRVAASSASESVDHRSDSK